MKRTAMLMVAMGFLLVGQSSWGRSTVSAWNRYCQSTNDNYRVWLYIDSSPHAHFEYASLERRGLFGGRVVRVTRENLDLQGSLAQRSWDHGGDFYSFSGRGNWSWSLEYDGGREVKIWANGAYMGIAYCN